MAEENKLVPSVEFIEDSRGLLEHLKNSKCNIRLFLKEGYKDIYGTTLPLNKDRMLRVYAEIHHDCLSSNSGPMIPKSRKEKGLSSTFVSIAPAYENQTLTFFLPLRDLRGKPIASDVPISYFGFDEHGGSITLGNETAYIFYTSRSYLDGEDKKKFDEKGKDFNLSEFGWLY